MVIKVVFCVIKEELLIQRVKEIVGFMLDKIKVLWNEVQEIDVFFIFC